MTLILFYLQYYEEDLRRLGSPVPFSLGSSVSGKGGKKKNQPKMSQVKDEYEQMKTKKPSHRPGNPGEMMKDEDEEKKDLRGFEFTAAENSKSRFESPKAEDGNIRRSLRTPKTSDGKKDKESTPRMTEKTVSKDQEDVEKIVRKSKREPKPLHKISAQEKPKNKKVSKKLEQDENGNKK